MAWYAYRMNKGPEVGWHIVEDKGMKKGYYGPFGSYAGVLTKLKKQAKLDGLKVFLDRKHGNPLTRSETSEIIQRGREHIRESVTFPEDSFERGRATGLGLAHFSIASQYQGKNVRRNPLTTREKSKILKVAREHDRDASEHRSLDLRRFDAGTASGLREAVALTRKNPYGVMQGQAGGRIIVSYKPLDSDFVRTSHYANMEEFWSMKAHDIMNMEWYQVKGSARVPLTQATREDLFDTYGKNPNPSGEIPMGFNEKNYEFVGQTRAKLPKHLDPYTIAQFEFLPGGTLIRWVTRYEKGPDAMWNRLEFKRRFYKDSKVSTHILPNPRGRISVAAMERRLEGILARVKQGEIPTKEDNAFIARLKTMGVQGIDTARKVIKALTVDRTLRGTNNLRTAMAQGFRLNPHTPAKPGNKGRAASRPVLIGPKVKAVEYYDVKKARAEGLANPNAPWRHDAKGPAIKLLGVQSGAVVMAPKGVKVEERNGETVIKGRAKKRAWEYR